VIAHFQSFFVTLRLNNKHTIMERKLRRSHNQFVAGVCAGFAEYMNWDPTLVRVLYVLLSICTTGFPGLLVYIICWAVMPLNEE